MSVSTSAAFALVVFFVVTSAGLATIPTMLPNDVYAMQRIKIKDGPGAVLCNAAGFSMKEMPPGPLFNMFAIYTGVDSCEKVREWKSSQGGSGGGGAGPAIKGNYPGYDPGRDAGYAGGIGSAGDVHTPYRSHGVDAMTGKPSR